MSGRFFSVAIQDENKLAESSVVAARLVEAACFARDGNCEAAKAQIARAMALLRGEPSTIPANPQPLNRGAREVVPGSLAAWQKRRLIGYIDAHLTGPIRVADLAELLDLSEGHFCRSFRSTFGTSPHVYITRRRIEVAQSLMLKSGEPLCAIALHCGLCDQSHFSRVFRRVVGETPYAWRRTRSAEFNERATEPSETPNDPSGVPVFLNERVGQTKAQADTRWPTA